MIPFDFFSLGPSLSLSSIRRFHLPSAILESRSDMPSARDFIVAPRSGFRFSPPEVDAGMGLLERTVYYGSSANLWEFEIPIEPGLKPAG